MNILAQKIITLATEKKITVSVAESITGGEISSALTSISGSSKVFQSGIVCYCEHSKIHGAGVDVRLIREKGVYCEEVVIQMAERFRRRNISEIGFATSGTCEDGDESCPKGTVYFALSRRDQNTKTWKEVFKGDRKEIQNKATEFALTKVMEIL